MNPDLKKITELTGDAPELTDVLPFVDLGAGATKKTTADDLLGLRISNKITVSATEPSSPTLNDLWVDIS